MPEHEHFEELCALAASGQITRESWETLKEHLQCCQSCAETLGNFGKIGADLTAEFVTSDPPWHMAAMRSRFLDRAREVGTHLSAYPLLPVRAGWKRHRTALSGCMAAMILLVVGGLFLKKRSEVQPSGIAGAAETVVTSSARDEQVNSSERGSKESQELSATVRTLEQEREALLASLKLAGARESELESRVTQLNSKVAADRQQIEGEQSERQAAASQLAQVQNALDEARAKQLAPDVALVSAQSEIANLNQQLLYEKASSEREKALLAAGKEGQSIIAARNLHIIDVYDADGRGERRSFGRVFYVEGQELVFYAYDLSDPRHANAQFYAWGAGGVPGETITRLGILRLDGQDEQRWVLKYSDPRVLSRLDSIFVTAETGADPENPKGKRVLFAVLSGQPNHP
jgi:hypothetical protein